MSNYPGRERAVPSARNGVSETSISSLNPAMVGQSVTFTAQLSATSGTPTGTIQFLDGANALSSQLVSGNGSASFTTSSLSVGSHTITANYQPTGIFGARHRRSPPSVARGIRSGLARSSPISAHPFPAERPAARGRRCGCRLPPELPLWARGGCAFLTSPQPRQFVCGKSRAPRLSQQLLRTSARMAAQQLISSLQTLLFGGRTDGIDRIVECRFGPTIEADSEFIEVGRHGRIIWALQMSTC